jgi:hypothetical protein
VEQGADLSVSLNWLINKIQISTIVVGNPTVINTKGNHHLISNDKVVIRETNCYPLLDGNYQVTVISANSFSVAVTTSEVAVTSAAYQYEREATYTEPYYGFVGIPKDISGYTWTAKIANNYTNSAGVSGILGSVTTGSNQILLNIPNKILDISVGDTVTIAGSGITNSIVRSIVSSADKNYGVLETVASATSTVSSAKITRTAGIIASFVITTIAAYGEITLALSASATNNIPTEGDRSYLWDLFGTSNTGSKIKLVKGLIKVNPSVI